MSSDYAFADSFRAALKAAREEAAAQSQDYIGTEHVLLGLLRDSGGVAATVLNTLDLRLDDLRAIALHAAKPESAASRSSFDLPYTSAATAALEEAMVEARQLGQREVCSEHLFLALLRTPHDLAAQVLVQGGANLERLRREVVRVIHADLANRFNVPPSLTRREEGRNELHDRSPRRDLGSVALFVALLALAVALIALAFSL